jgi:uncharacterized RDD family membrane protein YckC
LSDFDPAPTPVSGADLASPWRRLAATLVDACICGLPVGVALGVWLAANDKPLDPGADYEWDWLVSLAWVIYEIVPTALWGKTIGKHLVGIRVCSRHDLGRPGWVRSLKRWGIFYVVSWIPLVGGLLSVLIPLPLLWTAQRQGLHDMFAGTVVVRDQSPTPPGDDPGDRA